MGAFDDFCGSPYWNTTLTWDTDDPDFTPCFEKTALVWTPCLFLWIFLPLEVHYIRSSVNGPIRWNALNVSKLVLNFAAVVLSVVSLGHAIANSEDSFPVDYVTPIVRMLSYGLTAFLLAWNRSRGVRTSGLLSLFWFFVTVLTIPEFRTEIKMESGERQPIEQGQLPFVVSIIHFPVVTLILLLNCFVDREPVSTPFSKTGARCPEFDSSFFNRLVFGWYDKMAWTGFRRPLEQIDLWELNPSDKSDEIVKKFYKHWNKRNKKAEKEAFRTGMPKKTVSVLPVLFKCFGGSFIFASVLELVGDLFIFVSPQILKLLMAFVSTPGPMWKGIFYAFIMLISAVVQILLLAQFNVRMNLVGMRIRTALVSAIYRKSLSMSNVARKEKTVGEIVTLMAVDAQRFQDLGGYLVLLWSSPLQILIALFFLWDILGVAVLAGLVAMILLVPVNGYIANRIKDLQMKQMKNKDVRAKLMNEILNGIRVLKLYAWELPFGRKVNAIRLSEMDVLRKSAYLSATISFAFTVAPFLMSLVSFITYVLLDKNNVLDAQTVFVSLSLFNIMRLPLIMLPIVIMVVAQAAVSLKRINNFMNADDLSPDSVTHDQAEGADTPIKIQDGNFAWGPKEPPVLRDINLEVPKGSLVAVVGAVGCGKTSLLSAILGELERQSGQVNTMGSVAYVPQQAWIQNAKLKDNILFTKPLDSHFYSKVVDACALKPDFDMLAAGDQTEIGFKGINLSGGQKQRVSLARATYNDADVYLLDDPLSAVDSHVGKHIFDRVIGPAGLLKNKTRVLVTHGICFLPQVDRIVVIKDGAVSEEGTYQELLQRKGAFAEFLVQHIQEAEEEDDEPGELEDIKAHLEKAVGREELQRQLSLTGSEGLRSRTSSTGGSIKRNGSLSGSRRSLKEKEALPAKEVAGEKLIEDEGLEQGNVKMRVYLHYIKSIGLNLSLLTVFFNLCLQAFSVGANVWVTEWTKDPVMNDPNATDFESTRNVYLGVYAAFGGGRLIRILLGSIAAIFSMTSAFVFSIGCIASSAELHNRMFDRTMKCPMSFFDVTPIGRILNRFTKDVDSVDNLIPTQIRQVLSLFFSAIATLVVISYSTPIFIAFIVPLGILYYFLQRFYVSTSRQLKRLDGAARSPIYSHFTETLVGASSIRAYGMVDSFIQEAETRVDVNQKCYFPAAIANRWLSVRLETLGNTITFFAALLTVFRQNNIDSGTVGLSISYALQITAVLNYLVRFVSEAENSIVSVERIQQYEETPQEKPWLEKHVEVSPDWPSEGAVEFRQLALRYRDGLDLVLKGIDVSVGAGEKVGIVGRTGAGKSSLTLGLFRIVEAAAGHILIDGVDISHVDLSTLRSRVTIIPQDPVLFTGSLRLNLDPHEKFSDEEVWRALERSHLKTHVQGFAAGLNHEMNEGGENFSVGQRQLVCLARALLRKTKVLVFDEATAAVDLETDDLIQKTIREDFKDCTILTIAHRLNTIIDSDRVLVLEKGMVAEYDSPQTLLQKKDSMFYSLAKDAGLV